NKSYVKQVLKAPGAHSPDIDVKKVWRPRNNDKLRAGDLNKD
ncbi:20505_t:CDS:2, partial [Gigaspora rosea]